VNSALIRRRCTNHQVYKNLCMFYLNEVVIATKL